MLNIIAKALEFEICDNCLGRNFAQLGSGYTNEQRGKIFRSIAAFAIDGKSIESDKIKPSNFHGFKFRQNKDFAKKIKSPRKCEVCNDFFKNIDKHVNKISKELKPYDFSTFLVGTKPSRDLLEREEKLWEKVGIDHCEPIRAEINREIGKKLEKKLKKIADLKKPDISILLNLGKNKIQLQINPLFIFGYYNKLKRRFPQCKWGTPEKYKTSVEEIIGKPLLKETKGKDHKFHGAGREDIDAICLGKRAFVIEISEPKKRKINLSKLAKKIKKSKKVEVFSLRKSNMETVRRIKAARPDKTYRVLVKLKKSVKPKELKVLKKLKGKIKQFTPKRVAHRRANLKRERKVKSLKIKRKNPKTLELTIKGTAGLYIKELVSGDEGRTKPSVSELLGIPTEAKTLDVVKIEPIKL